MNIALQDSEIIKHKFTVEEFYQMGEAGIFGEDSRVELVGGDIIHMAPIGSNHSSVLAFLYHHLIDLYKRSFIVFVQNPLMVDINTELQPDIQILKFRPDYYRSQHPSPRDAIMVIEVAETSFSYDRTVKAEVYATAGIPHYAVVNTITETVEYYSNPEEGVYNKRLHLTKNDRLKVAENDFKLEMSVTDMFPGPGDLGN